MSNLSSLQVYRRAALLSVVCLSLLGCTRRKTTAPAGEAAARPIFVLSAKAKTADVPIYLEGIGSLLAWKTVTVRAQVAGKLGEVLFRDGQSVKQGQVLARLDASLYSAQLSQAQGALARDTALLNNHRLTLRRVSELRAQHHVAQQALDDEQGLVGQYEGAVVVDRAQLTTAELNLSYTQIVAPIDGVVGLRLVDEGNLVRPEDPGGIAIITQIDPIAVLFTLPQDDLPRIAARLKEGPVPVEAYSRQGETLLGTGQLLAIDNQVAEGTAMIRLKAMMSNPNHTLWPNQFVNARLLLKVRKDALVVPAVAVQHGPSGTFAYVVQKAGTAAVRAIKVEALVGDQAVIASGLSADEEVVIEGQSQLRAGAKVSARLLEAPAAAGAPSLKKKEPGDGKP